MTTYAGKQVATEPCKRCGFTTGEKVYMTSRLTTVHGKPVGTVAGTVFENAIVDSCHAVYWPETTCWTALPNPNVRRVS